MDTNGGEVRVPWATGPNKIAAMGLPFYPKVARRMAAWNRASPEPPIVVNMPDVWKCVREMGKNRSDQIAEKAPMELRQRMREQVRALGVAGERR